MQPRHQVLVITGLWLFITANNFMRVLQIAEAEGTPLQGAEQRIYEKLVLVAYSDLVRPYISKVDVTKPYADLVAKSPADSKLRCHYALLLAYANQSKEADRQIDLALAGKHPDPVCGALQAVLHGEVTPEKSQFIKARLQSGLSGWMLDYALQNLYRNGDQAAVRKHAVDQAARRVLEQMAACGAGVLINFVIGIGTIIVFLAAGRRWNLETEAYAGAGFNPVAGWAMVLVFPLTVTFVSVLIHGLVRNADELGPFFLVAVQSVVYAVTLLITHFAIEGKWRAAGVQVSRWGRSVLTGYLVFCSALVLVYSVALLIAELSGEPTPSQNPVFLKLSQAGSPAQWFIMWVLVGLIGPIFEEILFRGVVYTSMRAAIRPAWAIPLNGVVFSAVHGDIGGLLPLALLGALLAWTFERTGSVVASAVTHCLWNTQTFCFTILLFT